MAALGVKFTATLPAALRWRLQESGSSQMPTEHLHGRIGVAQRAGLNVHVVLDNGSSVTKRHDGHGVGYRGRNGPVGVLEASIVSQAGGVAALPLRWVLVTAPSAS